MIETSKMIRCVPVSAAVTFVYFFLLRVIDFRLLPNILIYFLGVLVFFVSYILQLIIHSKKLVGLNQLTDSFFNTKMSKLCFVIGIVYVYIGWNWGEQSFVNIKSILIMGLTIISLLFILSLPKNANRSRMFRVCLSCFALIVYFYCLYEPNFFLDSYGKVYHADAYTTSIINVSNGFPYTFENVGIYGHYGILYLLPVKVLSLFVSQWTAIAITIAMVGVLSLVLMILTINSLIDNDIIFAIATISLCFFAFYITYGGNYFQLDPHRYLFQSACLFGSSQVLKYRKRMLSCFMWIVSSLAIVWNLETGVVCLVVWTVCWLYLSALRNGWRIRYFIIAVLGDVFTFGLSMLIVSLYNLSCGGAVINLETFIYPLGHSSRSVAGEYNILDLSFSLSYPLDIWYIFIIILIGFICLELIKIVKFKITEKECVVFLSAFMGMGVLAYYMNMPLAENKFLSLYALVIVLSFIVEYGIEHSLKQLNIMNNESFLVSFAWRISTVILLLIFWSSFSSMYGKISKIEYNTHNEQQIDEFCSAISANIPQDTAFIGTGAPQLCAALNRRNVLSYMDFPDTNDYGVNYVVDMIKREKYDSIVLSLGTESKIAESLDAYSISNQFDYYDYEGNVRYSYLLLKREQ